MKKALTFTTLVLLLFLQATAAHRPMWYEERNSKTMLKPLRPLLAIPRINTPTSTSSFLAGTSIRIDVVASDEDGMVSKVEFYIAGEKVGEDLTRPFRHNWSTTIPGNYQLTARAYDSEGNFTTSSPVNITYHPSDLVSNKKYYVKAGALTTNNGLSPNTPFPTIQRAADLVNPGDTVFVMDGIYTNSNPQGNVVSIRRTGSPDHWIVFTNYPGHRPHLRFNGWYGFAMSHGGSYIEINGFKIEGNLKNVNLEDALNQPGSCNNPGGSPLPFYNGGGIWMEGRLGLSATFIHHHLIRNCEIFDCCGQGVATGQTDYTTIENNVIYNTSWYSFYGTSAISFLHQVDVDNNTGYKCIVRNNKCYNNKMLVPWYIECRIPDGNGVIVDNNNNASIPELFGLVGEYKGRTLITNNVLWHNGGSGIHAFRSNYVDIINNTAYMNNQSAEINGGQIYSHTGKDIKIMNNILVAPANKRLTSNRSNSNIVYDYNLHFGGNGTVELSGANTITADPQFVNAGDFLNADFRIKGNSPAIDKSTPDNAPVLDIDGTKRPRGLGIDIGAYEYKTPYNFTGIGNWTTPLNWYAQLLPPNPLPAEDTILISAAGNAQLDLNYHIEAGSVVKNSGTLNIPNAFRLDAQGGFDNLGTLLINGQLDQSEAGLLNRGIVKGNGRIIGNFSNGPGTLAPGNSPGGLDIDGNFSNGNGILEMELGGTTPQTEYDQLNVSGSTQLSGILKVNFINDYLPDEDQIFDLITSAGGIEGMFNEVVWSADYQGDVVNNINALTVSSLSVLPVALLDFTAQTQGQNVELQWRTASEQNNRGFYIERSRDRLRWKSIGFVAGQGNTDVANTYRFLDKSAWIGVNYYRLKQVDIHQSFTYSKVVSADIQGKAIPQAYPNPTTGELEIKGLTDTSVQVKLINALGETLRKINLTEGQGLDLSNEATGIYFLEWQSQEGQTFIQRIVKIK